MKMIDAENSSPMENELLASLPSEIFSTWSPVLEIIDLPLGMVLYESGTTMQHIYFPTTAVVSMLYVMESGESAEVAIVGNDGLVGVALFMGGESMLSRALVLIAGRGYRVPSTFATQQFKNCLPVLHLFLAFTQALMAQITQTCACNKHHSLDQQLCRWLLLTLDRHHGMELRMTNQLIADMVGTGKLVIREGTRRLQDEGLLKYEDGHITVLNRAGLEKRACECYALMKLEYARLLSEPLSTIAV